MMNKNLKRFASCTMAGALTLALAAPAFAAPYETEITATYNSPEVKPESVKFISAY